MVGRASAPMTENSGNPYDALRAGLAKARRAPESRLFDAEPYRPRAFSVSDS